MNQPNQTEMMASNFNLHKLDTESFENHLASSIKLGTNVCVFGRRGSGKTEIAKQQIRSTGCHEVYINLSVLERVDLGGYPDIMSPSRKSDFVGFLLPKFYETMVNNNLSKDGKPLQVVALLDEVDKAAPDLWAPLLEFVQFKTINGFKLPYLRSVIMTGNLISEGGSRPSLPLLDRAEKYLLEPSVEKWLKWAGKTGSIHPSITAFINDHTRQLYGSVDPEERYADPSPRGWANASSILNRGEALGISSDILVKKVSACVGEQAGLLFEVYFNYYKNLLPIVDSLFKGNDVTKDYKAIKDPSHKLIVGMIACSRFSNLLDKHMSEEKTPITSPKNGKIPEFVVNVGKFVSAMELEDALVAIRSQVGPDRFLHHALDEEKHWDKRLNELNEKINA